MKAVPSHLTTNLSVFNIYASLLTVQQAAHHPEVGEELRSKALQFSSECTNGYVKLLEQVLQVRVVQSHNQGLKVKYLL